MEAIFNRTSIRKYKDIPVEKGKIEKLLRAAMQAPSAANEQPWEFIVIENKETLSKLSGMSPYSKLVANSAVTFVILANQDKLKVSEAWQQDLGAATENLLLEATYLGLGAVWLGTATSKENMKFVTKLFNLPENIIPYAVVSAGYPDQKSTFVDRFNEASVHYESFK